MVAWGGVKVAGLVVDAEQVVVQESVQLVGLVVDAEQVVE
jgi:hypothetical protein